MVGGIIWTALSMEFNMNNMKTMSESYDMRKSVQQQTIV